MEHLIINTNMLGNVSLIENCIPHLCSLTSNIINESFQRYKNYERKRWTFDLRYKFQVSFEFSIDNGMTIWIDQAALNESYGFILNACVSYKNEKIYYVHISGGMLVYIISNVYNVHYNNRPTRVVSTG
ncbi:unnamed protein product, partial [Adineta steineri]